MTANKRIAMNVAATYGRSLYTLALGLFTARWSLAALGASDFGLLGLVGGLTVFISFLNSLMSVSTSRFFAFSIGEGRVCKDADSGIRECRMWFTSALCVHFCLAIVLVTVGYPLGLWVVRNHLVIPVDRMSACEVVWLMTCMTCFFNMVNVPFQAMYNAKQEIAEMTVYAVVSATANACFLYYAATHPRLWLAPYSVWIAVITIVPLVIMCIRAWICFPECRFVREGFRDVSRILQMVQYSSAQFFADFSGLIRSQGYGILVNRYLGPRFNASIAIGNRVADQALSLGSAMVGALSPAITNAAGAGDFIRMRVLSLQSCKLGCLLILFFAIPLMVEADAVMVLWLKTPPEGASVLCVCSLMAFLINRSTAGLGSAVEAMGRIAAYKFCMGLVGLIPVCLVWILFRRGFGIVGVGAAEIFMVLLFTAVRLLFSKRLTGIAVREWFGVVFVPVTMVFSLALMMVWPIKFFVEGGLFRIVITTFVSEIVMLPTMWYFAFSSEDRKYVCSRGFAQFERMRIRFRTR